MPKYHQAVSVPEFLEIFKKSGFPLLYRGQAKDWPLLPSIARPRPWFVQEPIMLEASILEKLQQYGHPFFHGSVIQESDWILHAQHYGLPTRLLDLTSNPLKALFFAAEKTEDEADGVVWTIDEAAESTFPADNCQGMRLYAPKHVNNRITAQESSFVVFPLVFGERIVKPLDESSKSVRLWSKILIPAAAKKEIKRDLNTIGINRMTIFPGIEGVIDKIKDECDLF